jgi:histidine kinase
MLDQLSASEARLRESEDKYRFLFNNGPSPIFVIDAETKMILDVNTRAEEEYQYSRAEFLRMNFADLGPERHREQTLSTLQHLFPDEVTLLPIQHHKRKDGSIFMISYQASLNTFHNRPAVIAAVWDVTERIEKHTKFIQTAKMATLGEMATGIAHELNQPLSIVRLGCDYLQKKIRVNQSFTQEDLIHLLKELSISVDRASKIINHLRQFGRVADGTMHAVDLRDPISNIFELLGRQLAASGIEWDLKFADDVPKILGDVNRLEQVFINLILNSKDAMLSWEIETKRSFPKIIRIRTFQERGFAVAVVSDTGPGISKDISSKIFEPFFTTKRIGEGTGLGLSISYGIIKEHHGIIEVDTSATQGAQFRLSFPPMKAESGHDKNTRS